MQWVFGDTWGRMAIGSTLFLYLDPSAKMQYVNTFEWKSTKMYMKDKYDKLSDQESEGLSHDIAKKIQDEMTYPGQVKITVIRETRAVSYAK